MFLRRTYRENLNSGHKGGKTRLWKPTLWLSALLARPEPSGAGLRVEKPISGYFAAT